MASRPTEPVPISGRVDREGRLIAADPSLERLQVDAGSALGRPLALPQMAALARAAASLGVPLSRALIAADNSHDLDLFVRAEPQGDEVELIIERWAARPAAGPRLALVETLTEEEEEAADAATLEFVTDEALNVAEISPALAQRLSRDAAKCIGQPLTSLFRLVEEDDGAMPLLAALASRSAVEAQRAIIRGGGPGEVIIDATPLSDAAGQFAGFHASLRGDSERDAVAAEPPAFEESLDEALRSPLDRIISAADRIVERSDGPLRSDYATYASDIAAAGRHLLSVIRSMGAGGMAAASQADLAVLAQEAAALVQPVAGDRGITILVEQPVAPCRANGDARAIVQILVNIIGNAVRHSPDGGRVAISFAEAGNEDGASERRVTIADQGPGIDPDDQQRIFERYEQAGDPSGGTGLGLAISRRLARSMGGDVHLDSIARSGARFTLVLPAV
jgi:hypothetical protein